MKWQRGAPGTILWNRHVCNAFRLFMGWAPEANLRPSLRTSAQPEGLDDVYLLDLNNLKPQILIRSLDKLEHVRSWSRDGRYLLIRTFANQHDPASVHYDIAAWSFERKALLPFLASSIVAIPVKTEGEFEWGSATTPAKGLGFEAELAAATPDHSRILVRVPASPQSIAEIRIIQGGCRSFPDDLRACTLSVSRQTL